MAQRKKINAKVKKGGGTFAFVFGNLVVLVQTPEDELHHIICFSYRQETCHCFFIFRKFFFLPQNSRVYGIEKLKKKIIDRIFRENVRLLSLL